MRLDPECPEARRLAERHAARRLLGAGLEGSRLQEVLDDQRRADDALHLRACPRCRAFATACPRCGRDGGRHSLFCARRWRRPRASQPDRPALPAPRPPSRGGSRPAPPRRPAPPPPHEVLGVPRGASPAQVRRAYHERAKQYHPDRTAGLAPELQRLAEERMREINEAYRRLRDD